MRHGRDGEPVVLLLAEDDPADQELVRRSLETTDVPHSLRIVEDGEEALDYLLRRGAYCDPGSSPLPDLVLLDLNMPRTDGRAVLQAVQQTPRLRYVPVVVLTTSSQERDIMSCYELGARSFVTKPARLAEFQHVIRVLVEHWLRVTVLPSAEEPPDAQ